MIYFLRNDCFVKIGYSQRPDRRVRSLQTSSPHRLELIRTEDGDTERERQLHERFRSLRVSGEWFRLDGDLRDYLGENLAGQRAVARDEWARGVADHASGHLLIDLRDGGAAPTASARSALLEIVDPPHERVTEGGVEEGADNDGAVEDEFDVDAFLDGCPPEFMAIACANDGSPTSLRLYYFPMYGDMGDIDDPVDDERVPCGDHDALVGMIDVIDYYAPEVVVSIWMVHEPAVFLPVPFTFLRKRLVVAGGVRVRVPVAKEWSPLDLYTGDQPIMDPPP